MFVWKKDDHVLKREMLNDLTEESGECPETQTFGGFRRAHFLRFAV